MVCPQWDATSVTSFCVCGTAGDCRRAETVGDETVGDTPVGERRRTVFDACGGSGYPGVCFGLVRFCNGRE